MSTNNKSSCINVALVTRLFSFRQYLWTYKMLLDWKRCINKSIVVPVPFPLVCASSMCSACGAPLVCACACALSRAPFAWAWVAALAFEFALAVAAAKCFSSLSNCWWKKYFKLKVIHSWKKITARDPIHHDIARCGHVVAQCCRDLAQWSHEIADSCRSPALTIRHKL